MLISTRIPACLMSVIVEVQNLITLELLCEGGRLCSNTLYLWGLFGRLPESWIKANIKSVYRKRF